MTLREMIDGLEGLALHVGDDADVRFALDPSWPQEYDIDAVLADSQGTVYIVEGGQRGRLPKPAADLIGW